MITPTLMMNTTTSLRCWASSKIRTRAVLALGLLAGVALAAQSPPHDPAAKLIEPEHDPELLKKALTHGQGQWPYIKMALCADSNLSFKFVVPKDTTVLTHVTTDDGKKGGKSWLTSVEPLQKESDWCKIAKIKNNKDEKLKSIVDAFPRVEGGTRLGRSHFKKIDSKTLPVIQDQMDKSTKKGIKLEQYYQDAMQYIALKGLKPRGKCQKPSKDLGCKKKGKMNADGKCSVCEKADWIDHGWEEYSANITSDQFAKDLAEALQANKGPMTEQMPDSAPYKREWVKNIKHYAPKLKASSKKECDVTELENRIGRADVYTHMNFNLLDQGLSGTGGGFRANCNAGDSDDGDMFYQAVDSPKTTPAQLSPRLKRCASIILKEFPDIVTVEECDRDDAFTKIFEDVGYKCHFTEKLASAAKGFNGGVHDKVGIFYNTNKFEEVCGPRPIFLPSTKKGMMYEMKKGKPAAAWGKQVAMWILLRNKHTGRLVAAMVAHNKSGTETGEDKGCKLAQSKRLGDILSKELGPNIPILFGCDFNNGTNTQSYGAFRNVVPFMAEAYEDVYGESPSWGSAKWRNAGGQPEKLGVTPNNIDFLFYTRKYFKTLAVLGYPTEDIEFCNLPGFKYPSDHFAHMAIYEEQDLSEKDAFRQEAFALARMEEIKELSLEELREMANNDASIKEFTLKQKILHCGSEQIIKQTNAVLFKTTGTNRTEMVSATPMTFTPSAGGAPKQEIEAKRPACGSRRRYLQDCNKCNGTRRYIKFSPRCNMETVMICPYHLDGKTLNNKELQMFQTSKINQEEFNRLLINQEIALREHNVKRDVMEKFDLEYSAYTLMCTYISCSGKKDFVMTAKDPIAKAAFSHKMIRFGKAFMGTKKEKAVNALEPITKRLVKSVTDSQKNVHYGKLYAHFEKGYSIYQGLSGERKDKKVKACLKVYQGICDAETVAEGKYKIPKDYNKESKCDLCSTVRTECNVDKHLGARRRRLCDSAAYLLSRHRQIHGVRTQPTLAALIEKIEEAQRN